MSDPAPQSPPPLGSSVLRGATAVSFSLAFTRAAAFGAQLALGRLLGPEDFGLYALAISLAAAAQAVRDGGIPLWLTSRGGADNTVSLKSALQAALGLNFLLCGILIACSFPLGNAYDKEGLTGVIIVIAVSLPVGTWASVTFAQLQVDLHFELVSLLQAFSGVLRYGSMILFAALGFGALSFVLPTLLAYAFEGVAGMLLVRKNLREARANHGTRRLLLLTRWSLGVGIASALANQVDFLIIGTFASLSIVGYYFFSYQFAYQLASLISEASQRILTPSLRAISADATRYRSGVERAMKWSATISAPVLLLSATVYAPLCVIAWGDRWEPTIWPVVILTAGLPLHILVVVANAALMSHGKFRTGTGLTLLKALFIAIAAGGGVSIAPHSVIVPAVAVTLGAAAANLVQLRVAFRSLSLSPAHLVRTTWYPLLAGWGALAGAMALSAHLRTVDSPLSNQMLFPPLVFLGIYALLLSIRQPTRAWQLAKRIVGRRGHQKSATGAP